MVACSLPQSDENVWHSIHVYFHNQLTRFLVDFEMKQTHSNKLINSFFKISLIFVKISWLVSDWGL